MSFHINAKAGEIADTLLFPGDPLRAKFIAENFLENIFCYNEVRNMFGYTGTYKGKRISVQGGGMGIPSTSIYAHELINEYGVQTIIRLGTCGSIREDIKLGEVILAMSASTDSNINRITFGGLDYAPTANFELLERAYHKARELPLNVRVGGVFSTDSFYHDDRDRYKLWAKYGILGAEMESALLYTLAAKTNTRALSILTVSDNITTEESLPAEERSTHIETMTKIALEAVV